jgi:hypothetical protein
MPTDNFRPYCKRCRRRFTRPLGTNRVHCFECRPQRLTSVPDQPADGVEGELTRYSREALDRAGILQSWQAAAVLALSRPFDAGKHGASGAAGTIRAHRDAMAVALEAADTGEVADVIDLMFREDES